MKMMKLGVAALLVSLGTGCASITYSTSGALNGVTVKGVEGGKPLQTVMINTTGFYLFWTVPIVSGDLRWDEEKKSIVGGTSLFQDQVGFAELQSALLKIAESRNCDLAEVYFNDSDSFYAGASYSGAVGSFFGSSHMSVSAILVPRATARKEGE